MAAYSKANFKTTFDALFPDNTSGAISEGDLRTFVEAIKDSFVNITDDIYKGYGATASGTDTYTATLSPAITAYTSNDLYLIKFTNANTGAATLNLNGLGAKSIVKSGVTALSAADINAGQILLLAYDGTNLQVVGGSGSGGSSSWGGISGTLSNQTDLQTELDRIKNLQQIGGMGL